MRTALTTHNEKSVYALGLTILAYSKKVCAFTLLAIVGRSQKRLMRTALTLAYILGVGNNEKKNGEQVKNLLLN